MLDCSGYGRVLPRLLNLEEPSQLSGARSACSPMSPATNVPAGREEGKIWACIHPGGAWIWIIPFSNGKHQRRRGGDAGVLRRYPERTGSAAPRDPAASDPNAGPRLAGCKFVFPPQRIAATRAPSNNFTARNSRSSATRPNFSIPIFSSGVTLALARPIARPKC